MVQILATVSEVLLNTAPAWFQQTVLAPLSSAAHALSSRSDSRISVPLSKVTLVYLAISLRDGGVFKLMALVLETPYNRHWHSKVVQLGLLRLSLLTVGLLLISQHGYRRRRMFPLFK